MASLHGQTVLVVGGLARASAVEGTNVIATDIDALSGGSFGCFDVAAESDWPTIARYVQQSGVQVNNADMARAELAIAGSILAGG
ncbi:MAG: hypothetical protein Q4G24_15470 [Paracoccus sp. (in: a-proteobacteria)]|uniref:hypothetical protein n=1 Tax=Paracoccus sp. TaxID=267 RepID=UPI0026E0D4AE|nr:hypothetical protein [Paracoccus sp. (in: a-proteobacteria)]MDO5622847.1 hypothetical protein [Paracoccus sp. (in: a-proteobacteria)]